ncbi:primase zinc finger [Dictyocaulus viviparus]|uniref:Primase zinc finger n=1 Tax=Dictyocaulus viviparus TaxID=29172 RepID=A0A0D8XI20_DICVI|nr:primase zinc finger [Dictyocaulus viviparus]
MKVLDRKLNSMAQCLALVSPKIELTGGVKKEVIELERNAIFGLELARKEEAVKMKRGAKLVDIDFNPTPKEVKTSTSQQVSFTSDSSDDEMMDRKKYLTVNGKLLQKQLKKMATRNEISKSVPTPFMMRKKVEDTVLPSVNKPEGVKLLEFDKDPKISSSAFECYVDGHKKLRLSELRPNTSVTDSWTTAGIIVSRNMRRSTNDNEYVMWKLHDLKNCQDPPATLLLFGEACKKLWKLQVGVCVALMTPQLSNIEQSGNVVGEGKFKSRGSNRNDFQAVTVSGRKCSNFVNVSLSEYCIHHVLKEARKLSAKRGAFNSVISQPPPTRAANFLKSHVYRKKLTVNQAHVPGCTSGLISSVQPSGSNMIRPSEMKAITRADEITKLKDVIGGRTHLLGARNMLHLNSAKKKCGGTTQSDVNCDSMQEFIRKQPSSLNVRNSAHVPRLGTGLDDKTSVNLMSHSSQRANTSSEDSAKLRAIAILKRRKEGDNTMESSKKQSRDVINEESCKRSKLSPINNYLDIETLLRKKSLHDREADKVQGLAVQKHLDSLEQIEKVETFVSECMEIKNVKVVHCKKCGYTAPKQSDFCMREGHCITKGVADKRFFKCGSCHKRTVTYGIMPTKACKLKVTNCDSKEWVRVPMKDERKVKLDNENLLVRGEERKFVNS